ncbi:MAG: patatin-like phospholipase family protein [Candidatus Zixiibacteriota bacterium]|nr:MAG: patatin-like phospholipase family protein [candidate division Zixibacteria bacterium]
MGKFKYKLALVLGGGGARGLAHIGVIRELVKQNIVPDLIVGTSMGAVVGGMYAQTLDIDLVEAKITDFVERFGTKGKWLGFLDRLESGNKEDLFHDIANYIKKHYMKIKALTTISLEDRDLLYEPLNEFFSDDRIENTRIPFAAVSIDLWGGRQIVINTGSIISAVYSSAAVQGVFPPLEYRDMLLADGGPVAVVPVEAAKILGAKYVAAADISMKVKREVSFTNGLEIILRSDSVSQERLKKVDLEKADLVISPEVQAVHWANFGRIKFCIEKGEIAAHKALKEPSFMNKIKPWWKRVINLPYRQFHNIQLKDK